MKNEKFESMRYLVNYKNFLLGLERLEIVPAADKVWVIPMKISESREFIFYGILRSRSRNLKAIVNATPLAIVEEKCLSLIIFRKLVNRVYYISTNDAGTNEMFYDK